MNAMKEQANSLDTINGSPAQKVALAELRQTVMEVGDGLKEVNQISESLKWGQPSFEATNPKTGSPVRMAPLKTAKRAMRLISFARQLWSSSFVSNMAIS
jgi:hypothetical protein